MKTNNLVIPYWLALPAIFAVFAVFSITSVQATEETAVYRNKKRTGDYEMMKKAHVIRFLVPYSKTYYYLDKGEQKGLTYEFIKLFEKAVNTREKKGHIKIKTVIIPTPRDRLFKDLAQGLGDVAAGNLTNTAQRRKLADFADPFYKGAKEIIVSSKAYKKIKSLEDLSGKEVYVRKSSSYHQSLLKADTVLKKEGKKAIIIKDADAYLEDEDLLEMVNARILPMIVVDNHKAAFWAQIFPDLVLHDSLALREGGEIGWAIRKNSPQLKQVINDFVKKNKEGSLHFNMFVKRYMKDAGYMKNNVSEKERAKFKNLVALFHKYADKYSFDWLMLAALSYQESGLDQSKKSNVGAIGIMQVMPATAKDPNVAVPDIQQLENNIHAGSKYLRFITDRYFMDQGIDTLNRHLFAFAAYNAGPARVKKLREEAKANGLDPNLWFNNVEVIAANRIGRETVQYVGNIYKYYIAYRLISETKKIKWN
jgi:membrane-bound lytic murein transglycosylase MltF